MKQNDLLKKIAKLESVNDQMAAELQYLEKLTRALGFVHGLKTLKEAAIEMLATDPNYSTGSSKSEEEKKPPAAE